MTLEQKAKKAKQKALAAIKQDALIESLRQFGFHPVREYKFAKSIKRQWKFDLAWPEHYVAFEFEGGAFSKGGHVTGIGFERNCLKYSTAAVMGWAVIRCTYNQVSDGTALDLLIKALRD